MSSRNVEGLINHQKRQRGSQEIPGRTRAFEPNTFTHNSYLGNGAFINRPSSIKTNNIQ